MRPLHTLREANRGAALVSFLTIPCYSLESAIQKQVARRECDLPTLRGVPLTSTESGASGSVQGAVRVSS